MLCCCVTSMWKQAISGMRWMSPFCGSTDCPTSSGCIGHVCISCAWVAQCFNTLLVHAVHLLCVLYIARLSICLCALLVESLECCLVWCALLAYFLSQRLSWRCLDRPLMGLAIPPATLISASFSMKKPRYCNSPFALPCVWKIFLEEVLQGFLPTFIWCVYNTWSIGFYRPKSEWVCHAGWGTLALIDVDIQ